MAVSKRQCAVFFDADGTLLDSLGPHIDFCRDAAGEELRERIPPSNHLAACRALTGAPMQQFLMNVGFPTERLESLVRLYEETFSTRFSVLPFDGIRELILTLRGEPTLSLCIVTSNTSKAVRRSLGAELESCFDVIKGLDNGPKDKVTAIANLLKDLQIAPSNAVYIGDTVKDWRSASDNCVRFIGVDYGFEDLTAAARSEEGEALPRHVGIAARPSALLELIKSALSLD